MITPSFGLTATERVLPKLALDFTTASLDSRITFTRALNTATRVNSSGNVETVNADVARFDYDPVTLACKGLLIEEARTNSISNNTMVGAVAGTPGTIPTGWTYITTQSNGLDYSIVGTGTENGISYLDVRFFGTTVNTNACQIQIDAPAALTGQTWTASTYWKLASGTKDGSWNIGIIEQDSGGGFVAGAFYPQTAPTSADLIRQRPAQARKLSGGATVAKVAMLINLPVSNATAYDFTLRIGMPQLEQGAFATSVIPTSSVAVTRNADVATMTGTNFSDWFNANEGTFSMAWNTPSVLIDCVPFTTNDNTDLNRIGCDTTATGFGRIIVSNAGNLEAFGGTSGIFVGKNTISVGYKNNNFGVANNGGTVTTDASGTVPTVDRLQIGRRLTSLYINGTVSKLNYWPQKLTTAEIQAFSK